MDVGKVPGETENQLELLHAEATSAKWLASATALKNF